MIANLVSGLIGAVLASILTVLFLWVTEVRKIRGETFVEVTAYLDEMWQLVQNIHAFLEQKAQHDANGYPNAETVEAVKRQSYRTEENRHRLTELINSSRTKAKLAYVYGETNELVWFNEIITLLRPIVTDRLSLGKIGDWPANSAEIHSLFKNCLDPARGRLERGLMKFTRIDVILKQFPCKLKGATKP